MTLQDILPYSKTLLDAVLQEGDIAIDATIGNGHDTVFLARKVGKRGNVYGFDIQREAIEKTKARLKEQGLLERVTLYQTSHHHLIDTIPIQKHGLIKAAVFNLGYLPRGNKAIVTKGKTTIAAVKQLLQILQPGGLIVLVVYHGHPEGKKERDELLEFVQTIEQSKASVLRYQFMNQRNDPPFILAIEKNSLPYEG